MSEAPTTEPQADPFQLLPTAVYRTIVADLYDQVPSPTLADPELIAERVHAAMAEIACMCPVNAEEARIAARVVIADAQARECIRHAHTLFNDPLAAMKCHAQANHHMRTANAARSLLLRVQAARRKREAVPATCNQDAWTIHATEGLLLAADGHPTAPLPPQPSPEPPPPPTNDDNKFARYDVAEQYAVLYPRRAAEIRRYGGIPPTATWGPPPGFTRRPRRTTEQHGEKWYALRAKRIHAFSVLLCGSPCSPCGTFLPFFLPSSPRRLTQRAVRLA